MTQQRPGAGPTDAAVANWFVYHPPTPDQIGAYERIRAEGGSLAETILVLAPPSPERTTALNKIREAVMWANAAIACNAKQGGDA